MHQHNAGAPFERSTINIAGAFPERQNGNQYLLIFMDYLTKWSEVYTIPKHEAFTVVEVPVTSAISGPQGTAQQQS
jgi:hypothetical protein